MAAAFPAAKMTAKRQGLAITCCETGPHFCTSLVTNAVTAAGDIGSAAMASSASRRRRAGVDHAALTA
jgi:hypothetical protein